jgi:hypothetical protein
MELLAALAEGLAVTSPQPDLEEGLKISAQIDPSFAAATVPPPKSGPFGMVKGFFKKTGNRFITKINSSSTLHKVEEKTVAAFESLGTQLQKGKMKITQSTAYQAVKTTTSDAVKSIATSAKGAYHKLVKKNPHPAEEPVPEKEAQGLEEQAKMQE